MSRIIRLGAMAGVLLVGLVAGTASAAGAWTPANGGTTVENGVITLDTTDAAETPAGTSLENSDLGRSVGAGQEISFEYTIVSEDTACGGGQPRVFIKVGNAYENTFDGNSDQCGTDADGDGWFTVTYTIVNSGAVTHAGVVFDNPSDRGIAQVRNVTIAGTPIFPASSDACKKGGWADAGYKNQGACVSSFANAK